MKAEELFLQRCGQIEHLLQAQREIELLDLAGVLRQLLLGGTPLVHKVNTFRVKLRFRVGMFRREPDHSTAFFMLEDGLDPDTRPPGSPFKEVNLKGFLGHAIVFTRGVEHSVSDVINFAANVAGGVHHTDNPQGEQKTLAQFSTFYQLGGLSAGIRQLKAISRVTLKGLTPLIELLKKNGASPSDYLGEPD